MVAFDTVSMNYIWACSTVGRAGCSVGR